MRRNKERMLNERMLELDEREKHVEEMFNKQVQELERIANLTKDEAKEYL